MECRSRVAIIVRSYTVQGSNNVVLSYASFTDNIIYSHDVKCDEHLMGHDNLTFAQLAMLPIVTDWNNIVQELKNVNQQDVVLIQVMTKGSSYVHVIPSAYYREESSGGLFGKAFAKMLGNTSKCKAPTMTDECFTEWGLNKLGYFLFLMNAYSNPDLISEIEASRLDYTCISDNLKTEVLTKAWLEYLHAILRQQDNPPVYTIFIPNEHVDECVHFCMRRGYTKLVYMFLQEHPCRLNESSIRDVTEWHNRMSEGK